MDLSDDVLYLNEKVQNITRFADSLPGVTIIHDIRDFTVVWMSKTGLEQIGATLEEVRSMTNEQYHARFFNEDDSKDYVPKLIQLLAKNDMGSTCTYFQQVRFKENDDWLWHITSTRILAQDDKGEPLLTISTSSSINDMHQMTSKAERILSENKFLKRNYLAFAKLGSREKEVLKLMALGKSTNEIAEQLFISPATVDTHRKNIRQKLNITNSYDLTVFAQAFDLI